MRLLFEKIKPFLKVVIAYLVYFILNEILISGGRSESNIYLIIFNVIVLSTILWVFRDRYYQKDLKTRIIEGLTFAGIFALLDFLLIDVLLYKFNHSIYNHYYTYLNYGILLIIPILIQYLPVILQLAYTKVTSFRKPPLDKPDSTHIIR